MSLMPSSIARRQTGSPSTSPHQQQQGTSVASVKLSGAASSKFQPETQLDPRAQLQAALRNINSAEWLVCDKQLSTPNNNNSEI